LLGKGKGKGGKAMKEIEPIERIENKIFLIRGQKVMLDRDLAELYGVETKYLNRQVKRNRERFPKEYMFQLTKAEKDELVTNWHRFNSIKHSTSLPYAFTEHGVAMLSAVLNSEQAIKVSILIINTFIRLRRILANHKELARKIEELERKYGKHELEISVVFKVLKRLIQKPVVEQKPRKQIGFEV
jgi:hypothetical protein